MKTGERRAGRFRGASADDLTIDVGSDGEVKEERVLKSNIRRVATDDVLTDGVRIGALSGAGALMSFVQLGSRACGKGCENDLPAAMPLIMGLFGGGVGAAVGFVADRLQDRSEVLFPPTSDGSANARPRGRRDSSHPEVRVGALFRHAMTQSALLQGTMPVAGFAIAGQIAPYVSLHAEYTGTDGTFSRAAGAVADDVLVNLVPATSRVAGWSRGIESRRITFVFSELVGVHAPLFSRVRLGFLAGLTLLGQEKRDYFDAYQDSGQGTIDDPRRHTPLPGKYYVLDFESPEVGLVYGVDAGIALTSRFSAVPTLRYCRIDDPGPIVAYGVDIHWNF
jgi:hypothetical protein